jgi:hypothetical protein
MALSHKGFVANSKNTTKFLAKIMGHNDKVGKPQSFFDYSATPCKLAVVSSGLVVQRLHRLLPLADTEAGNLARILQPST